MRSLLCLVLLCLPRLALAVPATLSASPGFTSSGGEVRLLVISPVQHDKVQLALDFKLKTGWHIYWKQPGEAGFPPNISAAPPVTLSPLSFPPPQILVQDGLKSNILSGHVTLPFTATQVVGKTVQIRAQWLECKTQCVPEQALFSVALTTPAAGADARTPTTIPGAVPSATTAGASATPWMASPVATPPATTPPATPATTPWTAPPATTPPATTSGMASPVATPGATPTPIPPATPPATALPLWVLALLGGVILNLMPCVFPVLAMKAVAFARLGGAAHGQIRREALGYSLGVVASMLVLGLVLLGLRAAGQATFWGFQFHAPVFVAVMAWILLAVGLSFAGLFQLPVPRFVQTLPARNSFLTGLLAVLVATPCTAPFMGAALAAALVLPALPALGLFLALGVGMALPMLALALLPHLVAALPRPGRWMFWVQRALSVPMFASCLWLGWVLFRQTGGLGVAVLLLGALLLVLVLPRRPIWAALVLLLLPVLHLTLTPPQMTMAHAQPYSAQTLEALRAQKRPVFIDLTASWCITCQVNEHTALSSRIVQNLFQHRNVALLVGDWTNRNPQITALLRQYHHAGVPLYLYYPPTGTALVLPQILTPEMVKNTILQAN